MAQLFRALLFTLTLSSWTFASENGGYYKCDEDILASQNQCVFTLTGSEPDDWVTPAEMHNVDRTVAGDFCRGVQSYDGSMLSVSPKPWVNGDILVASTETVTGDEWNGYALIFELMAPLRDMMMYEPEKLDDDTWDKYTKALTDCNSKTADYVAERSGGTPYSTSQVHGFIQNPEYTDIHHYILQYLEEGTMDLVCLSTELEMEHCDTMRETAGTALGTRCNCWFDAYEAIYGACPVVDMDFVTCENTTPPTTCAGVTATVGGGEECAASDAPGPSEMPQGGSTPA